MGSGSSLIRHQIRLKFRPLDKTIHQGKYSSIPIPLFGEEPVMISQFGKNKSLSILLLATAILVPGISLTNSKVLAQPGAVTFKLINGTDKVMTEFYASPPTKSDWEDDILDNTVLNPGESINITIDDGREDCDYDFRALFKDGTESVDTGQKVCSGEEYTYQ
jgi:hypothetical protein